MIVGIKFKLNESLYLKDPQETKLGKKILHHSILMINEIGIEAFTFKKLATEIGSAEKSIYRYFDNKHNLLLFLTSWYWEWVHYLIAVNTKNIEDPVKKLDIIIDNIVLATSENPLTEYINENILHRIVINEGSKAYHTFSVDKENMEGRFSAYKSLVKIVEVVIVEINPKFNYSASLASNLFEMANNQIYFAEHLPRLTSVCTGKNKEDELIEMMKFFSRKLLA
ncbi:MAG: AcrR family transcriptional regulator [Saprospiraceae bacterium]|jgi:AcrR family transcriptional regulator